jgi:NAD(P)-dependent dehydrogenase (short-subunit alcohol dehydrogenase family)
MANSRTALVTGAARGIGKAICEGFASAGYRVIGLDREDPKQQSEYTVLQFDLEQIASGVEEVRQALRESVLKETGGSLDVIVNNAALQIVKPMSEVTAADWEASLHVNVMAPFFLVQLFLEELKAAKGSVVNISSIHDRLTKSEFSVYASTKGALTTLTRALSLELAPDIRVNAISPAATDTEMLRAGFESNPDGLKELANYHPLNRIADPAEVAKAALYLASDESSFMTGSTLELHGGIGAKLHDPN